jgi:hypothetical protein
MKGAWPLLGALVSLSGCGTQFTDPILDEREPGPMCPLENVVELDGTAFGSAARLIQDDFSIEAWIDTPTSPRGAGFGEGSAIVFADVETVQTDDFAAGILNDKFVMSVGGPDTAATSVSDVATNEWVHVAATRTRANGIVLVYVNGVLEGTTVGNNHTLTGAANISIAGRTGRNFFSGLMAEVRLWRTVRSQSEIVDNMHHRLAGTEDGLVGYYRLDESSGTTASDSSSSVNDAAFSGPVGWVKSDLPMCDL